MKVNTDNIPVMAIGFTRAETIVAKAIQLFSGDLRDKASPNHAFLTTIDSGYKFALEETFDGLQENSLMKYDGGREGRIVCMYIWLGWTDKSIDTVTKYLAKIRSENLPESEYDTKGLLSFVPILRKWFKPDKSRMWCSESVATLHKMVGCREFPITEIAPDTLLSIVLKSNSFRCVLGYYK